MGYFEYADEMFEKSRYDNDTKLIKTIEELRLLSVQVRKEGLLSVEDDVKNIKDDFRKIIFMMMLDGIATNIHFDFGRNIIQSAGWEGVELRDMMLYNKGIAMISNGENPWIVETILNSMIGKYEFDGGFYEKTSVRKDS